MNINQIKLIQAGFDIELDDYTFDEDILSLKKDNIFFAASANISYVEALAAFNEKKAVRDECVSEYNSDWEQFAIAKKGIWSVRRLNSFNCFRVMPAQDTINKINYSTDSYYLD